MADPRAPFANAFARPPQTLAGMVDDPIQKLMMALASRPTPDGQPSLQNQGPPGSFDPLVNPDTGQTQAGLAGLLDQANKQSQFGSSALAVRGGTAALLRAVGQPAARAPSVFHENVGMNTPPDLAGSGIQGVTMPDSWRAAIDAAHPRPAAPTPQLRSSGGTDRPLFPSHDKLQDVPNVPQFELPRVEPKKISPKLQALMSNEDVQQKLLGTVRENETLGRSWYNMDPLRQAFLDELGPGEGERRFKLFTDMVAASSPRSSFPMNLRNGSFYYGKAVNGEAIPDKPPNPYGHMAQGMHVANARAMADGGMDLMAHPKPPSFAQNLQGNMQPVTVDAHNIRYPAMLSQDANSWLQSSYKPSRDSAVTHPLADFQSGKVSLEDALKRPAEWVSAPNPKTEYAPLEDFNQALGKKAGMTGAQVQASLWVGGGKTTGLGSPSGRSALEMLDDRIGLTAQKTGDSRMQVLRKMIRDGSPLLATLPLAQMGEGSGLEALINAMGQQQGQRQ